MSYASVCLFFRVSTYNFLNLKVHQSVYTMYIQYVSECACVCVCACWSLYALFLDVVIVYCKWVVALDSTLGSMWEIGEKEPTV